MNDGQIFIPLTVSDRENRLGELMTKCLTAISNNDSKFFFLILI